MNDQLIDLFHQSEDFFIRSISKECIDFGETSTAYLTGIEFENFNPLIIRKKIPNIDEILGRCSVFFEKSKSGWVVVMPERWHTEDAEKCTFLERGEKTTTMFIDLSKPFQPVKNTHNNIRNVDHNLEEWITPLIKAFESTPLIAAQYCQAHERALEHKANFHHFSLYEGPLPISSITLSINKDVGRIDDLGTLPDYQKRGRATHLLTYALEKAKSLGVNHCFLEASSKGLSIYKKIGFNPLFTNKIYKYRKNA